jgi:hypothetical protein
LCLIKLGKARAAAINAAINSMQPSIESEIANRHQQSRRLIGASPRISRFAVAYLDMVPPFAVVAYRLQRRKRLIGSRREIFRNRTCVREFPPIGCFPQC